ncbi:PAS domain-containing protein [Chondromyces apiculatus]|uniref:RsbR, positive regulator of sigma-B n=1 Tax=Chondromyces apiculatus DSM 436 TaxID=1192034 RepID=A0A017SUC2_9BACT|nr:PAS domain-containing protein [Chondromyces apiculatus]EYF00215.1 Hypothetical protein CAP_1057 [Chondromyces apiculatus DSM 436]
MAANDALALSPDLPARFLAAFPGMLCVLDGEGHVIHGNAAWMEVMGDLGGGVLTERAHDEHQARWLLSELSDPRSGGWAGGLRTASGKEERFHFIWGRDEQGLLHGVVTRVRADDLTEQSGERVRALVRKTDIGVIELALPDEIVSWNPAAESIFGFAAEEAIGQGLVDLLSTEETRNYRYALAGALRAGQIATTVAPVCTKEGREITCSWQFLLLRDERDVPIGVSCFVQDVTENEKQRVALAEQKRLLQAVLTGSPILVWAIDKDGTFTVKKGNAYILLGQNEEDAVGENIFEVYKAYPQLVEATREALAGNSVSYRIDIADQTWQTHLTPVKGEGGEVVEVLGVSICVTDQARLERELRQQLALLTQQQETIRALTTPVLQVWEGVLALPLVGYVDQVRAEGLMDMLLDEVVRTRARHAIVDVTGVESLDTATVHHIARLVRAVQLLGAEGILTGVRPAVAQSMVSMGVDLPDVPMLRNLQAGLLRCLRASFREKAAGG